MGWSKKRINHLVDGQTSLEVVAAALLSLHAVALREFKSLEKSMRQISRADARVRLLMSTPGVGPLVALTYVAAIDDPVNARARFAVWDNPLGDLLQLPHLRAVEAVEEGHDFGLRRRVRRFLGELEPVLHEEACGNKYAGQPFLLFAVQHVERDAPKKHVDGLIELPCGH
jgi:hypothetical protein